MLRVLMLMRRSAGGSASPDYDKGNNTSRGVACHPAEQRAASQEQKVMAGPATDLRPINPRPPAAARTERFR